MGWYLLNQKGLAINGALNNDNAGFDVDINGNGNTIALGIRFSDVSASNAGEVKVYDWDGASWVQKRKQFSWRCR